MLFAPHRDAAFSSIDEVVGRRRLAASSSAVLDSSVASAPVAAFRSPAASSLASLRHISSLKLPGGRIPLFRSSTLRILSHRIPPFAASLVALGYACVVTTLGSDDGWFKYYPLPFALERATGPSMMPTAYPDGRDLYLRDCLSHRVHLPRLLDALFDGWPRRFWRRSSFSRIFSEEKGGDGGSSGGDDSDGGSDGTGICDFPYGRPYRRGDVVTYLDERTRSLKCKRVTGVAGDDVRVHGAFAERYRADGQSDCGVPDDARHEPPYCRRVGTAGAIVVPPGHVWLEGDNPPHSTDSRHFGPVPASSLRGRIVLRLWPLHRCRGSSPPSAATSGDAGHRCVVGSDRPEPPSAEEMTNDEYGLREITEGELRKAREERERGKL